MKQLVLERELGHERVVVVDVGAVGAQPREDLHRGGFAGVGDAGLVGDADEQDACVRKTQAELDEDLVRAPGDVPGAAGERAQRLLGDQRRTPALAQRMQQVVGIDGDAVTRRRRRTGSGP